MNMPKKNCVSGKLNESLKFKHILDNPLQTSIIHFICKKNMSLIIVLRSWGKREAANPTILGHQQP